MTTHDAPRTTKFVIRHSSFVIGLLLVDFFFRPYHLAGLGVGLEHVEVAEWLIADGIRHGDNALFFKEAYGQEPLFLYLMAGSTALIGDNVMGVRFTSVFVAMLTLAAAYRLLRRMFSPLVALVALAGMSIALWPVFWGRVGLRAMTLPLTMCLAFDFLWRGLTKDEGGRMKDEGWDHSSLHPFIMAGIFFCLAAYTYLSSRAIPILVAAFTLYLALFARDRMRDRWRSLFVSYTIGALIAMPLAITVLTNPDLQFRVSEVSEPLDKALAGDPSQVVANVSLALGMFTQRGDSTVRDNWPNRPVFPEPAGALLFSFGALIALTRFTQPRHALALIWIGAMLIPTIVTSGAPNFTRTLGALPMVFALPGLAVEWLSIWPRISLAKVLEPWQGFLRPIFAVGLLVILGVNAASTYDDYFNKWPAQSETQFVFQADFAAIAKDIDASRVMDVSVGGLSNDTMDEPSLYLLRQRKDVRVRWFDSGSPISSGGAILFPNTDGYIYIPTIVPFADDLKSRLQPGRPVLLTDNFSRYQQAAYISFAPVDLRWFNDSGSLVIAGQYIPLSISAGGTLRIVTQWQVHDPIQYPRRIFVHLVDPVTGQTIAQHDGLDSPSKFWRPYDQIAQLHVLNIPAGTSAGEYQLIAGLYDPVTGQRVLQTDYNHTQLPSDHVVLGVIEVVH